MRSVLDCIKLVSGGKVAGCLLVHALALVFWSCTCRVAASERSRDTLFSYLPTTILTQELDSYSFNPHKWLLTNFDCCALWAADQGPIKEALSLTPVFLQVSSRWDKHRGRTHKDSTFLVHMSNSGNFLFLQMNSQQTLLLIGAWYVPCKLSFVQR